MLQSAGIAVIASVEHAADASTVLRRVGADAVVVSALTAQAGVTATRTIIALDDALRVLVLGRRAGASGVQRLLDAGARGYLALEQIADADLVHAVRRVAAGDLHVRWGPSAHESSPPPPALGGPLERLTPRERQVLALVASGRSTREIAVTLGLSVYTIAAHRRRLMRTLDVHKSAALVRLAVHSGLVAQQ